MELKPNTKWPFTPDMCYSAICGLLATLNAQTILVCLEHHLNDKAILNQLHGLLAASEPLVKSAHSPFEEHTSELTH